MKTEKMIGGFLLIAAGVITSQLPLIKLPASEDIWSAIAPILVLSAFLVITGLGFVVASLLLPLEQATRKFRSSNVLVPGGIYSNLGCAHIDGQTVARFKDSNRETFWIFFSEIIEIPDGFVKHELLIPEAGKHVHLFHSCPAPSDPETATSPV